MVYDEDTDMVFFSSWLADKRDGCPDFWLRLVRLLDNAGVRWGLLNHTNDYWARDYMPVQLSENRFLKYRYRPDYLMKTPELRATVTDCSKTCRALGLECLDTDLVIDGGNIVPCGEFIVMTDKVFTENGREKYDPHLKSCLEKALESKIIFIPWHPVADDVYGHSDGFVKYCGGNRLLMSNYRDTDEKGAGAIRSILESYGYHVTEMSFEAETPSFDLNWAYINFLQVGNVIIAPCFGIEEDEQALRYIREAFPSCTVYQVAMEEIARKGGALHCISWNIKSNGNLSNHV